MLNLLNELQERLSEASFPFFVLHGEADALCQQIGSQMLYDQASSTKKQLKLYPGAYHQVHNEPNGQGDEAIGDIVTWITNLLQ
jgi:acylglycerol lipase